VPSLYATLARPESNIGCRCVDGFNGADCATEVLVTAAGGPTAPGVGETKVSLLLTVVAALVAGCLLMCAAEGARRCCGGDKRTGDSPEDIWNASVNGTSRDDGTVEARPEAKEVARRSVEERRVGRGSVAVAVAKGVANGVRRGSSGEWPESKRSRRTGKRLAPRQSSAYL
jgi:hypothetical protein